MELESIEVDSCVRGHHVYNRTLWTPFLSNFNIRIAPSSLLLLIIMNSIKSTYNTIGQGELQKCTTYHTIVTIKIDVNCAQRIWISLDSVNSLRVYAQRGIDMAASVTIYDICFSSYVQVTAIENVVISM